jgi:dCTP deaminase
MILSDREIIKQVNGIGLIEPFVETKVERSEEVTMSYGIDPQGYTFRNADHFDTVLDPLCSMSFKSLEFFNIQPYLCAFFYGKSSYTRKGLIFSTAVVDAGYRGCLSLVVFNASSEPQRIYGQQGLCQIVFHQLSSTSKKAYNGFWQNG